MDKSVKPKAVVIGGGTGTFVVLSGLKQYDIDLTAIISVADSGGSTGRLRDEFGFQPVGDLRQALAALASDNGQTWIRKMLLYRFNKGNSLEGHNLGNLLLTALQDMTGSTSKALEIASKTFRLSGNIYPITEKNIQLVVEYEDGTVEVGEKVLDEKHGGKKIIQLKTSPKAPLYPKAKAAIETADLIILGPGDLYGSILANLVIDGIPDTFARVKGKIIYVANLMTRYTQTHNLTAADHVNTIETAIRRQLDTVIINDAPIPADITSLYQTEHEYPVKDDLQSETRQLIRGDFIKPVKISRHITDKVPRSYLRHDSEKLAAAIMELIERKGK